MAQNLQVLQSQRKKPLLTQNGFTYNFVADGKLKKIWECENRRIKKGGCPARLHTTSDLESLDILMLKGSHNHEPNAIRVGIQKFRNEVKKDAAATIDAPAQVLSRHLSTLPLACKGKIPLKQHIKRNIRHVRETKSGSHVVPHCREDINLPESFKKDSRGNNFLLYDSGEERDRVMIFGTEANLKFLKQCDMWFCDGTFKVAPPIFDQLFVIHGYRKKTSFPLLFCLTPNRTAATYKKLLSNVKRIQPGLQPKIIMSDFEQASINAFGTEFPGVEQKGCFFHFRQAVLRKLQKLPDVFEKYSNDAEFSLKIRYLIALAFVPPQDVGSMFDTLIEDDLYVENELLLTPLLDYFESTWIGNWNRLRRARLQPLYKIDLWNCYNSILEDLPKTNNHCEAFNRGFASKLGASNPTIYKIVTEFQKEQDLTETAMEQLLSNTIQPPSAAVVEAAQKLKTTVLEHADYTPMEQLRRLAYCISPK